MYTNIRAFVPLKSQSQRLPGKNLITLGGKPLFWWILEALTRVGGLDAVDIFVSDPSIWSPVPPGVTIQRRPPHLDGDHVTGTQLYREYVEAFPDTGFLLAHATSPFLKPQSIEECVSAVKSGEFDSALTVEERKEFFRTEKGEPVNFSDKSVPRTQDLKPLYVDTSGLFIFHYNHMVNEGRRLGDRAFLKKVTSPESIDIDEPRDFQIAKLIVEAQGVMGLS